MKNEKCGYLSRRKNSIPLKLIFYFGILPENVCVIIIPDKTTC